MKGAPPSAIVWYGWIQLTLETWKKVWNLGAKQLVKEAPELRQLEQYDFINIKPIADNQTSVSSTATTMVLLDAIQSEPGALARLPHHP